MTWSRCRSRLTSLTVSMSGTSCVGSWLRDRPGCDSGWYVGGAWQCAPETAFLVEMRNSRAVWDRSRETFSRMIVGSHFEELAREWVRWYGREAGLDDIGHVGSTVVSCREHRGHEVDVVALSRDSRPRSRGARITLVGEAKSTNQRLTTSDSQRLRHILDLLAAQGLRRRGRWVGLVLARRLLGGTGEDRFGHRGASDRPAGHVPAPPAGGVRVSGHDRGLNGAVRAYGPAIRNTPTSTPPTIHTIFVIVYLRSSASVMVSFCASMNS
jgi:hypothetical protein